MRMTLDETWKNCLSMWRWIAKEVRNGNGVLVERLKKEWLENHGFKVGLYPSDNCFFCIYKDSHNRKRAKGKSVCGCDDCPACYIDRDFYCCDFDGDDYSEEPIKFYNKLVSLNRKRLKAKK